MKSIVIIPIKSHSTRVKGKNFRRLAGKKLYQYIIEHVMESNCFDKVCIDTDSKEIIEYCIKTGIHTMPREPWLASDEANGNDLIVHHAKENPSYELYFQLFATAPFLKSSTIKKCYDALSTSTKYDSVLTCTKERGWFWCQGLPVNYRPGLLPRSQDSTYLVKETTGLYGIRHESLNKYKCRIGAKPKFIFVEQEEAVDLDTESDFIFAEMVLNRTKY